MKILVLIRISEAEIAVARVLEDQEAHRDQWDALVLEGQEDSRDQWECQDPLAFRVRLAHRDR